uniref:non-specific serine/threonine protein kinase n=1 Tax=Melanaphis sacchari TaxID=742174 RepID=A0A2H8TH86_9HEMI
MSLRHITILSPSWIHVIIRLIFTYNFTAIASSPEYLGCFLNIDLNTSNGLNISLATLTPQECSDECHANNYTYAAINNEPFCRCTNNYMSKLMKEMDDDCNVSCSAAENGSSDMCQTHFKMFKTHNSTRIGEEKYPQAIYLGCYGEKMGDDKNRLLKFFHKKYWDNTPQKCSEECFKIGFLYSGTTNAEEEGAACWCGNQYPSKKFKTIDTKCNSLCSGDRTKNCGGLWRLSVYSTGIVDYPLKNSVGCYNLDSFSQYDKKVYTLKETIDSHRCFYICNERGFKYAAVSEDHCECSYEIPSADQRKKQEECNQCTGDESEYCGGPNSISVYENDWFGIATGNLSKTHLGCFENNWMYPIMDGWNISFPKEMTSLKCVSSCFTRGYPFVALVSSTECLCSFVSPPVEAKLRAGERHCNAACSGGKENVCGDRNHYNVFTTGLKTSRVPGNHYLGCYEETDVYRAFKKNQSIEFPSINTPNICYKHCDKAGYEYFQLSSRESCFCGKSHPAEDGAIRIDDNQCSAQCSGDANKYCGGTFKIAAFRIGMVADKKYNCSTDCECYFFPKSNVSKIDCSRINLTDPSTIIPDLKMTSSSIDLILKDNAIEVLPNLTSFRITLLDVSNNSLTTLDADLLPKTLKTLFANSNKLTTLNDNVLSLMKSLNVIMLSDNPWPCECDLLKILLKYKSKIGDLKKITCASSTDPFIHMNEYEFCKKWKINYFYLLIALGFILFVCLLSIYFNLHRAVWSYMRNVQCDSCGLMSMQHANNAGKDSEEETFMQRIQYDELVLATDNWNQNHVLGEGGFGVVYKGNWRHTDVAIKRLKAEGVAEKVINMHTLGNKLQQNPSKEIMYLNAVKHDNVLSMYGFCFHSTGSCLIYQFMANGSLEDRLQCKNGTKPLLWTTRGNIATGIARGLQFLHNVETPLIHGDIKSANILLDSNLDPRIGDFGLARTGPLEKIDKSIGFDISHVCGTKPYLPEDFCKNKKLSTKVDTYSFGVVMFEIATGLRAFNRYKNYKYLKEMVNKHDNSTIANIADKSAGYDPFHIFEVLITLGKTCVADIAEKRPEMVVVYMNLQNYLSSKSDVNNVEANDVKYNKNTSKVQLEETKNKDFIKLDGIKAALLAPLHEIPSISNLYSSPVHETTDPRKIITAEVKSNSNEISDEGFFTTDF